MQSDKPVLIEGGIASMIADRLRSAMDLISPASSGSISSAIIGGHGPRLARAQARAEVGDGSRGIGACVRASNWMNWTRVNLSLQWIVSLTVHSFCREAVSPLHPAWLRKRLDVLDR